MKRLTCISATVLLCAVSAAHAQRGTLTFPHAPLPPPKPPLPALWVDTNFIPPEWSALKAAPPVSSEVFVYEQKQFGGHAALVSPEQARGIIDRFKAAYPKLGNPRLLIYVNRELVDEQSEMKLIHRVEKIEASRTETNSTATVKSANENTYRASDKAAPTLADKQTVRDVERLFGRPLRQAGANLVDQKVATDLIAGKSITEFIGTTDTPQARKDREAIAKIADVVIEVLISSKTITVPTIADAQTVAVPDIQATAIRLSDSKILGQAFSADVTNRVPPASLAGFTVPEITEATALALMEDLTTPE